MHMHMEGSGAWCVRKHLQPVEDCELKAGPPFLAPYPPRAVDRCCHQSMPRPAQLRSRNHLTCAPGTCAGPARKPPGGDDLTGGVQGNLRPRPSTRCVHRHPGWEGAGWPSPQLPRGAGLDWSAELLWGCPPSCPWDPHPSHRPSPTCSETGTGAQLHTAVKL